MNRYFQNQIQNRLGCVKHYGEDIGVPSPLMIEVRECCGANSSSATDQTSENYQVAAQSAPGGPSFGIGSGAQTGAITATTSDSGNVQTNSNNVTINGDTGVALAGLTLSDHALTAAGQQADHAEELASTLGTQALTTATTLGTSAINLGAQATGEAFQFAQNEAVLNYNALNQNTALAFSTIAALDTAQSSGAISAATSDLSRLASQIVSQGTSTGVTPVYITTPGQTPSTTSTSSDISTNTILVIAAAIAALIFGPKLLKA